ncbi:Zinc finger, RING-type [Dillenia turbinata]|uniref:RING-type E3 ubiquitin transferase n=1 Tax=Dillenia turbinata TaxID=194707 RepID=A0AAN8VJT3_9MAGN
MNLLSSDMDSSGRGSCWLRDGVSYDERKTVDDTSSSMSSLQFETVDDTNSSMSSLQFFILLKFQKQVKVHHVCNNGEQRLAVDSFTSFLPSKFSVNPDRFLSAITARQVFDGKMWGIRSLLRHHEEDISYARFVDSHGVTAQVERDTERGQGGMVRARTEEAISALHSVQLRLGEREVGERCLICLEEFEFGENYKRMPCSHLFNKSCIVGWFKKSFTCPLCRYALFGTLS